VLVIDGLFQLTVEQMRSPWQAALPAIMA